MSTSGYPCELIRDLLPAYADQITTDETNQVVQDHLRNCAACADYYSYMRLAPSAGPSIPESAPDTPSAPPNDYIDYMKKLRERRMQQLSVMCCILLVLASGILMHIRHQNGLFSGDPNALPVSPMIQWTFSEDGSAFEYQGAKYEEFYLNAPDGSLCNTPFTQDEETGIFTFRALSGAQDEAGDIEAASEPAGPAFSICRENDFLAWLLNTRQRSNMYALPSGAGATLYFNSESLLPYVNCTEADALSNYYGDAANWAFFLESAEAGADPASSEIDPVTDAPGKGFDTPLPAEGAAGDWLLAPTAAFGEATIREDRPHIRLLLRSKDGLFESIQMLYRGEDGWYWAAELADQDPDPGDLYYLTGYRLPNSIEKVLNAPQQTTKE